eukprot:TRINITY_DN4869_c0_g1_i2.p1 TRINITY_DN4869_c0_g1~~TRINITY_DN4869_c0_g1_i2.p1  ORF type:complete len:457 (+),score=107.37 TRINITY_DN4869_c0_g1_i2:1261-2631(+)
MKSPSSNLSFQAEESSSSSEGFIPSFSFSNAFKNRHSSSESETVDDESFEWKEYKKVDSQEKNPNDKPDTEYLSSSDSSDSEFVVFPTMKKSESLTSDSDFVIFPSKIGLPNLKRSSSIENSEDSYNEIFNVPKKKSHDLFIAPKKKFISKACSSSSSESSEERAQSLPPKINKRRSRSQPNIENRIASQFSASDPYRTVGKFSPNRVSVNVYDPDTITFDDSSESDTISLSNLLSLADNTKLAKSSEIRRVNKNEDLLQESEPIRSSPGFFRMNFDKLAVSDNQKIDIVNVRMNSARMHNDLKKKKPSEKRRRRSSKEQGISSSEIGKPRSTSELKGNRTNSPAERNGSSKKRSISEIRSLGSKKTPSSKGKARTPGTKKRTKKKKGSKSREPVAVSISESGRNIALGMIKEDFTYLADGMKKSASGGLLRKRSKIKSKRKSVDIKMSTKQAQRS